METIFVDEEKARYLLEEDEAIPNAAFVFSLPLYRNAAKLIIEVVHAYGPNSVSFSLDRREEVRKRAMKLYRQYQLITDEYEALSDEEAIEMIRIFMNMLREYAPIEWSKK